jgi:hypothetical protein
MRRATRVVASLLGVLAGFGGPEHGIFEILQGDVRPESFIIASMGPPCKPEEVRHACEPAMTVIPSFLATGGLAVAIGLPAIIWSVGFVQRTRGGLGLILLSVITLLVGGGFVAPFIGIIAGDAGTGVGASETGWRTRLRRRAGGFLAALWASTLIALLVWFPGAWILGHSCGWAMLWLSSVLPSCRSWRAGS